MISGALALFGSLFGLRIIWPRKISGSYLSLKNLSKVDAIIFESAYRVITMETDSKRIAQAISFIDGFLSHFKDFRGRFLILIFTFWNYD